jgi:hypothetical protein
LGATWESVEFHRGVGPIGWSGRASLAAVIEHHNVDAIATASAALRFVGPPSRNGRIAFGAEASVDALIGDDGGADIAIGPRVEFGLHDDRRFGLFVRWFDGGNPLGISATGLMAGFDFVQGLHPEGKRVVPPEIAGFAAAGVGDDGRSIVRLDVRVATPPFLHGTRASIEVDGNVLTSDDRNDLFYLYDVGVAHPFGSWIGGVWFHHRSNHVVNDVNPTVTSINVLEGGIESEGWNRAEPGVELGKLGAIDARLRAGWLIDSSFGEDVGWHARGGVRFSSPPLGPTRITVTAALERGDVASSCYGAGVLLPRNWDLELQFRHDEHVVQLESAGDAVDRDPALLTGPGFRKTEALHAQVRMVAWKSARRAPEGDSRSRAATPAPGSEARARLAARQSPGPAARCRVLRPAATPSEARDPWTRRGQPERANAGRAQRLEAGSATTSRAIHRSEL